ncbi:MAG TPA: hypothetical protein PLD20_02820 [Blastocatellia bacterium]|nr:hypothetical protein [Blastocatellia bacterium]HMV84960.1 hypothetical protein [Blastocatellia bacterium]HMY70654.1 hypothetical protein [Blastocatellia bacterium]HMZ16870.1 hypothetical protein [Blastocatellia bacterium]HNG32137.1 hypothetical protein [Blastocatellia bacterium]
MPNSQKPTTPDFVAGLQLLFGSLPSEQQRGEAMAAFDKLIGFLADVREKFAALPTREQAAELQPSLAKLEELFRYAERSLPGGSLATDAKPKKSGSRAVAAKESEVDISSLAAAIKRLPAEGIQAQLEGRQHSVAAIKAVAATLGIKPGSKETKVSLVSRIVNHIENIRMSDRLAGRTDSEWSVSEPTDTASG